MATQIKLILIWGFMIVGTQKTVPIITAKIVKKANKIHRYEKVKKIKPRFSFGMKIREDIGIPLFPEMYASESSCGIVPVVFAQCFINSPGRVYNQL